MAQKLSPIYENIFSEYSYGFRPGRNCHTAMNNVLEYLNDGFEWVIDLDIKKYFDSVGAYNIMRKYKIRNKINIPMINKGLLNPKKYVSV